MQRKDWKFDYTGSRLAEAARTKKDFHAERIEWWKQKKNEVMATIRAEGLEVDESITIQAYRNPKGRDWERGTQVMIRNDLRRDLEECMEKLAWHTDLSFKYGGWLQMLEANPEARVPLDIEDWLFFFGSPTTAPAEEARELF